jgi:protein-L-isoaspartate(D-aspartate) O-methyltransferase
MHELIDQHYFKEKRDRLIHNLRGKVSEPTLTAMSEIPRHLFASPLLSTIAYDDRVLPILKMPSLGRPLEFLSHDDLTSLSQPKVIGEMTDLLKLKPADKVLEIGTGTGYQAAILSKLAAEVVTVDVFKDLSLKAKKRLEKLGIDNVHLVVADGSIPFTKKREFDKIIVTASVPPIAPHHPLLELLKPYGLAVMPLGGCAGNENACEMLSIRATEDSYVIEHRKPGYSFVSLQGRLGWEAFFKLLAYSFHEQAIEDLKNQ